VIDVNTGRFVGSRSRSSPTTLEDTITKNNIEAVKEVVRQLRLRDVGGIIVIDFIDMANPKNRATVEEALRTELERDRTKTYVVEISPLGLVEMTRQNVTEGPREVLTKKCPTCSGDGIVVSEASAAVEAERRIRAHVRGSRSKAFRIELNARVAGILIGPGARRLQELEVVVNRRLVLEGRENAPLDHLVIAGHGSVEKIVPAPPLPEGSEVSVKLVEVGKYDLGAGVGVHKDLTVCVGDAAKLVGKRARVRVERVLDGTAYATLVGPADAGKLAPITAESQAEQPTRGRPRAKKPEPAATTEERPSEPRRRRKKTTEPAAEAPAGVPTAEPAEAPPASSSEAAGGEGPEGGEPPKRKTRRGSRGGCGRKRKTAAVPADGSGAPAEAAARIHLPSADLGATEPTAADGHGAASTEQPPAEGEQPGAPEEGAAAVPEATAEGGDATPRKRKTRRGSRGGRGRKRKTASPSAE
jgi:ribonuclease G